MFEKFKKKRRERKVDNIIKNIKEIKIQGARNIAKSALYAYSLSPTKQTKKKLINSRPTEPMLVNTIHNFEKLGYKKTLEHFDFAQSQINKLVSKLIKNNSIIFTHCHSTNVINSLIYAKTQGKKFQVYNTETRPLYQGRITSEQLKKHKIQVTMFIDSALGVALEGKQEIKKPDYIFLGADAILKNGIINKIGGGIIAQIAKSQNIPVYIIADSWKFTSKVKLEQRSFKEIWKSSPQHIKIKNPAFEFVDKKYISKIISELGVLSLSEFVRKVKKKT